MIWQNAPAFASLSALNDWLAQRCRQLWHELPHPENKQCTLAERWQDERGHLMPVPATFDGFVEHSKRVTSTCLVIFEHNRYSVPASFANKVISLRVYADKLVMVAEAQVIATDIPVCSAATSRGLVKRFTTGGTISLLHSAKPGSLAQWGAPFKTLPQSFHRLQTILLKRPGGDREMVDILALVLLHDEHRVEQAVTQALGSGQPSKQHVLNCLSRLSDKPAPVPLKPPPRLRLVTEPVADTARYDNLREANHDR